MSQYIYNIKKIATRFTAALAVVAASALTGCGLVNDDTDCFESYNLVKFVYDHNMAYSCAFDTQVDEVSLLLFDASTGKLVKRIDAPHSDLNDNNELELSVAPGKYKMLVWAGGNTTTYDPVAGQEVVQRVGDSYAIETGSVGSSTMADFHARTLRDVDADGTHHVRRDIAGLYHSMIDVELPYASPSHPNYVTVPLKKNTNTVRVVLQQTSGGSVDPSDYDLAIYDSNGWVNHDNTLRDATTLAYHPWYEFSGSVDINSNPTDAPTNRSVAPEWASKASRAEMGASLWELTTGRLMKSNDPRLRITSRADGRTILDISVNDYALLVKGFYHKNLTDQEYLDRQDEYNMTFFLTGGGKWASSVIIINDWRIIRNEVAVE